MICNNQTSTSFRERCDKCGRFISKEDVLSDELDREDVAGGSDYCEPYYVYTCRNCTEKVEMKKALREVKDILKSIRIRRGHST